MKRHALALLACLLPAAAWGASAQAPSNSIHVIWPYNIEGIWAFDDETRNLVREPFVGAINSMIDTLVTNVPDAKVGFRLLFSADLIPGYDLKLVWRRREGRGDWYYCEKLKTEGWLCPALLKYFSAAPKELYVKVEALPKEWIEAQKKKRRKGWDESRP